MKQVHVFDTQKEQWVFNQLWDDGTNVMNFKSRFGFIAKDSLSPTEEIRDGWIEVEA